MGGSYATCDVTLVKYFITLINVINNLLGFD